MERVCFYITIYLFFMFSGNSIFAQSKYGHIYSNKLIVVMPDYIKLENNIHELGSVFDEELGSMYINYETKEKMYKVAIQLNNDSLEVSLLKEIRYLQENIKQYQINADKQLKEVRAKNIQLVYEKAQKAIDEVAKEKSLDYIFDASKGQLLFAKESLDILPAVKVKLGVK